MDISSIEPLMAVQDPPAADSPKHILNILNNHCIQSIFERIDDIRDYHNAANVCTRFQANALKCFPTKLKVLEIDADMPSADALGILKLFGHLLQSVDWWESDIERLEDAEILNAITTYCAKTLKIFEIKKQNLNVSNVLPQFTALETFATRISNVTNFESRSPLKKIEILSQPRDRLESAWFAQSFPQLESISLRMISNLTDQMVIDFLNLNPQLRSIDIMDMNKYPKLTTAIFNDIGLRVPRLERLRFETWSRGISFDDNMRQLGNLTELRNLTVAADVPADELIQLMVDNGIPIETLFIDGIGDNIANAPTMPNLRNFNINKVSADNLSLFVKKQPKLTNLYFNGSEFTMTGLTKILEYGEKLETLDIFTTNFDVDEPSYHSVLASVRNRVKLCITINIGSVTVPPNVIALNAEWFALRVLRPRQ